MATITVLPAESLLPQQLREWAIWWGSPGCGASRASRRKPLSPQQCREWALLLEVLVGLLLLVVPLVDAEILGVDSSSSSIHWRLSPRSSFAPGGVEATSLGACDSASAGAEPKEALHTFTLESGASRCFFRHSTTVTPLTAPVPVTLADPSEGPIVARGASVLPCPVAPSGLLTGLHLPSFTKKLVATSVLQDLWVTVTQPGGELVAICTDSRTGEHHATFTRKPGSGLYTLTTESALVVESGQVAASVEVVASSSRTRLSSGTTVLATPPCHAFVACTPVSLSPEGGERYFLLVVDDYTRYTMVFPLQSKAEVCSVLIRWIRAVRRQLSAWFQQDLPVLRLHSDQGGDFSSGLLEDFCGTEGIRQTFTVYFYRLHPHRSSPVPLPPLALVSDPSPIAPLPPQVLLPQGLAPSGVSQVEPFSLVEPVEVSSDTSGPAEGGDPTPVAFVTPRRSARLGIPPGFPPRPSSPSLQPVAVDSGAAGGGATGGVDSGGAECPLGRGGTGGAGAGGPGTSRQEALSPERPCEWAVQWGSPGGEASRLRAGGAGTARAGAAGTPGVGGSATGGTGVANAASRACTARAGGAGTTGATGGTQGAAAVGAAAGSPSSRCQEPLSPERLLEWAVCWGSPGGGAGRAGAAGSRGAGPGGASAGVLGVGSARGTGTRGTGAAGGTGGAGPVGASAVVLQVEGTGGADIGGATGGTRVGGASRQESLSSQQLRAWAVRWVSPGGGAGGTSYGGAVATGARGSGGATTQPQQSLLRHLLSLSPAATKFPVGGTTPPLLFPPTDQNQPQLLPGFCLPALAPHMEVIESLTERREPETRASTPVRGRRVVRPCAPTVLGTHHMALRPSCVPQRAVLPSPHASSLPHVPDPESDLVHIASPTITRLLATNVTGPSFERFELECLEAAAPHLASTLLCPEGDPDALDIPTPRTYAEAITGPYSSQWQIAMDAEMASWKSTGTYVNEVPPPGANIVHGMWISRVRRPPGSPPAFKVRYVARGFNQREGVDFFHTFFPTPKITPPRVLLHVAAQRDYELHSLDFSTTFLQGSLHEAMWLHHLRGFTGSFPEGTQWSLWRPVYGLRQAPREWHDTMRTTLAALGFAPSTADPSLFQRTDTSLPPFYVLVYVDDLVFATVGTEALALVKAELQERHTCTDLGEMRSYLGLQITQDRARHTITLTQSHMVQHVLQHFDFSLSSP
ncbi:unnamed protein product [Closterium sp. NIES-53]